jgi:sialic acid synthase SpsE
VFKNNMKIYNQILGQYNKEPLESEKQAIKYARRSLVAATDIEAGTKITKEMLTWKRPGTGISPKNIELVIGRKALVDIKEDDILTWELF